MLKQTQAVSPDHQNLQPSKYIVKFTQCRLVVLVPCVTQRPLMVRWSRTHHNAESLGGARTQQFAASIQEIATFCSPARAVKRAHREVAGAYRKAFARLETSPPSPTTTPTPQNHPYPATTTNTTERPKKKPSETASSQEVDSPCEAGGKTTVSTLTCSLSKRAHTWQKDTVGPKKDTYTHSKWHQCTKWDLGYAWNALSQSPLSHTLSESICSFSRFGVHFDILFGKTKLDQGAVEKIEQSHIPHTNTPHLASIFPQFCGRRFVSSPAMCQHCLDCPVYVCHAPLGFNRKIRLVTALGGSPKIAQNLMQQC